MAVPACNGKRLVIALCIYIIVSLFVLSQWTPLMLSAERLINVDNGTVRCNVSTVVTIMERLNFHGLWEKRNTSATMKRNMTGQLCYPITSDTANKSGEYVSMCERNYGAGRLGNQMFHLATMLYVAHSTNRTAVVASSHRHNWLEKTFELPMEYVEAKLLVNGVVIQHKLWGVYDESLQTLSNRTELKGKSILICGWFLSWKYTIGLENQLRRLLKPLRTISDGVRSFFNKIRPAGWPADGPYLRVGIHVRVGDLQSKFLYNVGYTIPKRPYFELAMANVTRDTSLCSQCIGVRRVQFIVASENIDWVKRQIQLSEIGRGLNTSSVQVDVQYSTNHTAGFDMTLLSMCDAVIITCGTFGWWGAWLANSKRTIFFRGWPRPDTAMSRMISFQDFYPPSWISFPGPIFEF